MPIPLPYLLRNPALDDAPPPSAVGSMQSPLPILGMPAPANVSALPIPPTQAQRDQSEYARRVNTGSGIDQIQNPFLRGLARTADIAGSVFAPLHALEMAIPGTQEHHNVLVHQAATNVANDQAQAQADAQTAQTAATTQHAIASTRLTNDQAAAAEAPPSPEYDYKLDANGNQVAIRKGTTEATPVTVNGTPLGSPPKPITSAFELWHQQNPNGTVDDFNKVESKPMSQVEADTLNSVTNGIAAKHGLPLNQFRAGMPHADALQLQSAMYGAIGKQQGDTRVAVTIAGQNQRAAMAKTKQGNLDFDSPDSRAAVSALAHGDIALNEALPRGATFGQRAALVAAAKAINPDFNSGDHAIENGVRRYMTSGQGGSTLTAGNTLTHHLDLYDKAVDGVHNGDVKALNALGNEMGVQLGSDAQTNLRLIQQGVAMEAARFYTGGVPGEKEIDQFHANLSGDGSPAQMHGGANTVRAMAHGKMEGLRGQAASGAKGQANFGDPNANQQVDGHWDPVARKVVYH